MTMRPFLPFLGSDDLPRMTRPNYVAELQQVLPWGIVIGTVEGSMVSIVASKTFGASPLLTTVIWAIPILMNVLNPAWAAILRGRRRRPAFLLIAACGLVGVGSVGLTSANWHPWGGWVFAAQIALTYLFLSGLITLRTTIWRANYPVTHRGRIAARLQSVQLLLTLATTLTLSLVYNRQPDLYRVVYPAAAIIGACSLWPIRRWRMRGERQELSRYRQYAAQVNHGRVPSRLGLRAGVREALAILRTDRRYANYMLAQFLLGSANFFTDPILVNAFTKDLRFDYFSSQALLQLVPSVVLLLCIHRWAAFFDRVGLMRFRVYNSAAWVASYVSGTAGMLVLVWGGPGYLAAALPLLILSRALNGLGSAGGKIAWSLGHLHYAREHQTELYMGIHVGLTGVRGLTMPLLGLCMQWLLGYGALLIAVALGLVAHVLFHRMEAQDAQRLTDLSAAGRGNVPAPEDAT